MATIAFGGGPTTEQRRAFASLKDGAQVPGYRGYIPQIKYRVGQTYGNDTSDLSKELGLQRSATVVGIMQPEPDVGEKLLPKATGDNKYTERMVPGYTGYVPRMTFKFGETYKRKADACIDEFLTNRDNYNAKIAELNNQTAAHPRLTAISYDPEVRDRLNLYRDTHPLQPILMEDKKGVYEAPIPGYQGYVPRIGPTQIGLGQRYKVRTQQGLNDFANYQERKFGSHSAAMPSQMDRIPSRTGPATVEVLGSVDPGPISIDRAPYDYMSSKVYSHRIYPNGGMIPKYTGYVPQRRYVFGNTYGDTTRSLEVCSHQMASYGDYLKTKPWPRPIVPC